MYHGFHKNITQKFWTLIMIRNIFRAANLHIGMISEGSCDTEEMISVGGKALQVTQ